MNTRNILCIAAVSALFILPAYTYAQDYNATPTPQVERRDSIQSAARADHDRMSDAKDDRRETRARSKEAKRVERDASRAARESRIQVRTERRAQRSRNEATRQAKRAADAREKSDKN
jgi:hypothetical protein